MRQTILATFLALTAVGAAQAAEEHVALFKNVTGSIQVVRQNTTIDATPGRTLYVSDRLVSGAGASAGIVFKDGTLLTLGPSSEVVVRDYAFEPQASKYEFSVFLSKGSAVYSSGKIGKLSPDSVKVGTPTATVGVRGTRFLIQAE